MALQQGSGQTDIPQEATSTPEGLLLGDGVLKTPQAASPFGGTGQNLSAPVGSCSVTWAHGGPGLQRAGVRMNAAPWQPQGTLQHVLFSSLFVVREIDTRLLYH